MAELENKFNLIDTNIFAWEYLNYIYLEKSSAPYYLKNLPNVIYIPFYYKNTKIRWKEDKK